MNIKTNKYWKELIIEFKFTSFKKLPFEIGTISASGSSICEENYITSHRQKIGQVMNEGSKNKVSLLGFRIVGSDCVEIDVRSEDLKELRETVENNKNMEVVSIKEVTLEKK